MRAARTRRAPGSLMPGVPASLTSATLLPGAQRGDERVDLRCASLCRAAHAAGWRCRSARSSVAVTRVSSAAITSALRRMSSARSVTSRRLPIGVATTYNDPPRRETPALVTRGRSASCSAIRHARSTPPIVRSCALGTRDALLRRCAALRRRRIVVCIGASGNPRRASSHRPRPARDAAAARCDGSGARSHPALCATRGSRRARRRRRTST